MPKFPCCILEIPLLFGELPLLLGELLLLFEDHSTRPHGVLRLLSFPGTMPMQARTFFPSTQSPPRRLAQGIFQLDEPNAQYSFQLSLEVPAVSVTVYDDFGGLVRTSFTRSTLQSPRWTSCSHRS